MSAPERPVAETVLLHFTNRRVECVFRPPLRSGVGILRLMQLRSSDKGVLPPGGTMR